MAEEVETGQEEVKFGGDNLSQVYLDPEGGYPDPEAGKAAEIAAMTR